MLVRWNPFYEISRFDKDLQSLFGDFFVRDLRDWSPAVDIYEDSEKITVEAELPGIDPQDVEVLIDKDKLTIKGSTALKETKQKKDFLRTERTKGSFMRSFVLPPFVESDEILASWDKGVLTISIPKRQEEVPRKVKIKMLE